MAPRAARHHRGWNLRGCYDSRGAAAGGLHLDRDLRRGDRFFRDRASDVSMVRQQLVAYRRPKPAAHLASSDIMMAPEAANMPPTLWQTEILAREAGSGR